MFKTFHAWLITKAIFILIGISESLGIIGFILICLLIPNFAYAADKNVNTYIPPGAEKYLPLLKVEIKNYFPEFPQPYYFGALVEHESCISLSSKRCWNPESRLKTSREEGAGFGQTTRAYNRDGTIRFDAVKDLKNKHSHALKELAWSNIYQRPDLQLRAMVLLSKDNYNALYQVKNVNERIAFADAAYNGGLSGVQKERRACGLKKGCDPQVWFDNVEVVCLKSKKPLYGNRSACDINRHHVSDVLFTRKPKYEKKWSEE